MLCIFICNINFNFFLIIPPFFFYFFFLSYEHQLLALGLVNLIVLWHFGIFGGDLSRVRVALDLLGFLTTGGTKSWNWQGLFIRQLGVKGLQVLLLLTWDDNILLISYLCLGLGFCVALGLGLGLIFCFELDLCLGLHFSGILSLNINGDLWYYICLAINLQNWTILMLLCRIELNPLLYLSNLLTIWALFCKTLILVIKTSVKCLDLHIFRG